MMSQIRLGAILSYLSIFINIIIGIVYTPWMINSIGQSNFGLYSLTMSVITLLALDFGLGNTAARFISKYSAENKTEEVGKIMGIIYKLYIGLDFILLILLTCVYLFIPDIYKGLSPDDLGKFKVVYAIASIFCVLSFPFSPLNGVLTAYERFIWLKGCDIIHKLVIVVLMSIALLCGFGLYALVLVNAIAGLISIIIKIIVVKRETTLTINWSLWDNKILKLVTSFSIWTTITLLAQRCIFNLAPSVLGMVSTAASIAILGVAITIEGYTYTFASAINGMFLPRVSKMLSLDDHNGIMELMIRIGRIQIMIIGLIILGFIVIGQQFVNLWVGRSFSLVYQCAVLLILPSFIHLPQEIATSLILAANKVRQNAMIYIIMAIISLLLGYPLAKNYGAPGICLAICISYFVRIVLLNILYYKKLNLNIPKFFKETFLKMLPALLVSAIAAYVINMVIAGADWMNLIAKGVLISFVYVCVFILFAMNNYEKNLIFGFIKRKIK